MGFICNSLAGKRNRPKRHQGIDRGSVKKAAEYRRGLEHLIQELEVL